MSSSSDNKCHYMTIIGNQMHRKIRIEQNLSKSLNLEFISVDNESSNHSVPANAETHFKIIAVSVQFEGLSLIKRHRLINQLCAEEFNTGLHALSMHLFTPNEWLPKQKTLIASPNCKGGFD